MSTRSHIATDDAGVIGDVNVWRETARIPDTPTLGKHKVYFKTNDHLHHLDDAGTETVFLEKSNSTVFSVGRIPFALSGGKMTESSGFVFDGTNLALGGGVDIGEVSTVPGGAPGVGRGVFWVRDDAPNVPMFTDDTGVDFVLNTSGGITGTGVDNQVSVWDGVSSQDGSANWTFDRSSMVIDFLAVTSTSESLVISVTDDATGNLLLGNRTSADGVFAPGVLGRAAGATTIGLRISGRGETDTGTIEGIRLDASTIAGAAFVNRDVLRIYNASLVKMQMFASGNTSWTGDMLLTRGPTGSPVTLEVRNTSTGANSGARLRIEVGNATTTSVPQVIWNIPAVESYWMGIENSATNNPIVVRGGETPASGDILYTCYATGSGTFFGIGVLNAVEAVEIFQDLDVAKRIQFVNANTGTSVEATLWLGTGATGATTDSLEITQHGASRSGSTAGVTNADMSLLQNLTGDIYLRSVSGSVRLGTGGNQYARLTGTTFSCRDFGVEESTFFNANEPAQIVADQNDYDFGSTTYVRVDSDAIRTITGLAPTGGNLDGSFFIFHNDGANDIILSHEDVLSSAANRITSPTGANITIAGDESVIVIYDDTATRWIPIAGTAFAGAGLTGSGTNDQVAIFSGTSTLDSSANFTFDGTIVTIAEQLRVGATVTTSTAGDVSFGSTTRRASFDESQAAWEVRTSAAQDAIMAIINNNATATSDSYLSIEVDSAGGNPFVAFDTVDTFYSVGTDHSDGEQFKITMVFGVDEIAGNVAVRIIESEPMIVIDTAYGYNVDTPTTLAANQNNYILADEVVIRLAASTSPRTVTGFVAPTVNFARYVVLVNVGTINILIANQSGSSTASNRVITGTGATVTLGPDATAEMFHDPTTDRWRILNIG